MADQPLNAGKVEYLDTDLGGATTWLVPDATGTNFNPSAVSASQNSSG
jgi:hypothetical protein